MYQYQKAESVKLIFSGDNFFDALNEIISSAKEVIHLQTYIYEADETGKEVAEKLKEAIKRGVKVYVLADGFGSKKLQKGFINELKQSGINFRLFSPLFSSESVYLGRRLHHKIVVADSRTALVGGINIANKYHGTKTEAAWLDYAVLVKGSCCEYLHTLCEQIYEKKNPGKRKTISAREEGTCLIRFRVNDWMRGKNEIHHSYREALMNAEKSVTIIASYFLPGHFFRKLLKKAVARGVLVRVIEAGKTDLPLVRLAEKYLYRYLLDMGVEVYEWHNSVMHGKAVLIDGKWSTIGSYNLNYLSHYRSIELNADIKDKNFISEFSNHLSYIIENRCRKITKEEISKGKGILSGLKTALAYHFFRIGMKLFLPKKRIAV